MAFGAATFNAERGSEAPTRRRSAATASGGPTEAAKGIGHPEEPDELEESCDLWELQHQRQLQRLGAH